MLDAIDKLGEVKKIQRKITRKKKELQAEIVQAMPQKSIAMDSPPKAADFD
jgi:hypothetical protein